jgi:hypothetical protein
MSSLMRRVRAVLRAAVRSPDDIAILRAGGTRV